MKICLASRHLRHVSLHSNGRLLDVVTGLRCVDHRAAVSADDGHVVDSTAIVEEDQITGSSLLKGHMGALLVGELSGGRAGDGLSRRLVHRVPRQAGAVEAEGLGAAVHAEGLALERATAPAVGSADHAAGVVGNGIVPFSGHLGLSRVWLRLHRGLNRRLHRRFRVGFRVSGRFGVCFGMRWCFGVCFWVG